MPKLDVEGSGDSGAVNNNVVLITGTEVRRGEVDITCTVENEGESGPAEGSGGTVRTEVQFTEDYNGRERSLIYEAPPNERVSKTVTWQFDFTQMTDVQFCALFRASVYK